MPLASVARSRSIRRTCVAASALIALALIPGCDFEIRLSACVQVRTNFDGISGRNGTKADPEQLESIAETHGC